MEQLAQGFQEELTQMVEVMSQSPPSVALTETEKAAIQRRYMNRQIRQLMDILEKISAENFSTYIPEQFLLISAAASESSGVINGLNYQGILPGNEERFSQLKRANRLLVEAARRLDCNPMV